MSALVVTYGRIEATVNAYLWGENGRGIKDIKAINLACEGATRVENGGFGCTRMVAIMLRCKCGSISSSL
jgi:hypothetical protein